MPGQGRVRSSGSALVVLGVRLERGDAVRLQLGGGRRRDRAPVRAGVVDLDHRVPAPTGWERCLS